MGLGNIEPDDREPISQHDMEELMEAYKALRGRLFQHYRSRMLLTIAEAVTERVYGGPFARSVNAEYRAFDNHSREPWVPDPPPASSSAEVPSADRQQLPLQEPLASPHSEVSDVSRMLAEFDSDEELLSWDPVHRDGLGSSPH